MRIFVSGATGAQGGNIAQQLVQAGHSVVTISSKDDLPHSMETIKGGFSDSNVIEKALSGVDAAVFTFPLLFDLSLAAQYAQNFATVARAKNVPLVIFNTSFDLASQETGMIALDTKVRIKSIFDRSGLNVITLMPDIYIDNFAAPWLMPAILNEGILPYPIASGQQIPFISLFDLGRHVVAAVDKPSLAGRVLPIGGRLLTGEEIASAISMQIDKKVEFLNLSPDAFEKQLAPAFGGLAAREISNLYRYVDQQKNRLVAKDFATSRKLLFISQQTLTEWVQSVNWSM